MSKAKAEVRLPFEVEEAALWFREARKAFLAEPSNKMKEDANHAAYQAIWAAAGMRQDLVLEALKFIGVYRDR